MCLLSLADWDLRDQAFSYATVIRCQMSRNRITSWYRRTSSVVNNIFHDLDSNSSFSVNRIFSTFLDDSTSFLFSFVLLLFSNVSLSLFSLVSCTLILPLHSRNWDRRRCSKWNCSGNIVSRPLHVNLISSARHWRSGQTVVSLTRFWCVPSFLSTECHCSSLFDHADSCRFTTLDIVGNVVDVEPQRRSFNEFVKSYSLQFSVWHWHVLSFPPSERSCYLAPGWCRALDMSMHQLTFDTWEMQ